MKKLLSGIVPLLSFILLGCALSWLSIYAFWFSVRAFHNVPVARLCDGIGTIILKPAGWLFNLIGADQTAPLFDPQSYSVANGLIIGVGAYGLLKILTRLRVRPAAPLLNGAGTHSRETRTH